MPTKLEAEEELRKLIDQVFQFLFRIGLLQLILGSSSLIFGVLTLHLARESLSFPLASGVPVWNGLLVLVTGVLGVCISKGEHNLLSSSVKCSLIGYFSVCNITVTTSALAAVYGAGCIAHCAAAGSCKPEHSSTIALSALNIIIGLMLFVCQIFATCTFCRKSNKPKRRETVEMTLTTNAQTVHFLDT